MGSLLIPGICSKQNLSMDVKVAVTDLLNDLDGIGAVQGKKPSAVASAVIYTITQLATANTFSFDNRPTQVALSDASKACRSAIAGHWKEYKKCLCDDGQTFVTLPVLIGYSTEEE